MKIILCSGTIMAGPDGVFTEGMELDLPVAVAKNLVDQRKADQVEKRRTPKEATAEKAA